MPHALITGASIGLGRATALALAREGWSLTVDARRPHLLDRARAELSALTDVRALVGDVTDRDHRHALLAAARERGPLDLLVNNASTLGGSPLPALDALSESAYDQLFRTNVLAPQQLIRTALQQLSPGAVIVAISSDAAVEHYPTWGGYGSMKAALDHQTLTWAAEMPQYTWYAVDPGDLRTEMHQAAFPGEDISDRPDPATVAPTLVELLTAGLPSGRYRLADIAQLVPGQAVSA